MHTSDANERLYVSLFYFISIITPLIGPAILWFIKRNSTYVTGHAIHYLNFVISYFLYQAFAGFFYFIGIGVILNGMLTVMMIVFTVFAGIYAYQGKEYSIPLTIRIFS